LSAFVVKVGINIRHDFRSGLKIAQTVSCMMGSILVIPIQYATALPAADPLRITDIHLCHVRLYEVSDDESNLQSPLIW
jgi:hypothetical protein